MRQCVGLALPADLAAPRPRRHVAPWLVAAALLIVAAAMYAVSLARSDPAGVPAQPSIAVLPFVDVSADPANEYLAGGMTEELIDLLAQVPGIQVAARTSSFVYEGKALPADSIARALRVRNVLEGSVRQSGDRVRITARLVDARTGYHIWSDAFERPVDNVFAVQDSIGRAVVQRLRPRLIFGAGAGDVPRRREPRTPEAHVSAMKGWRTFRLDSREAYIAAAGHFQDAIRRDPEYGYAIAGLATVRHWQAAFRHLPPDSAYAEARALAHRALALDSSLVDGWLVLGRIAELVDRDDERALEYFDRAVAVAPSDARAYQRQALLLARLGRQEDALAAARRGLELDPASPATHAGLAWLYATRMGRRDLAAALLDTAASLGLSNVEQASILVSLGDTARAIAALARAVRERDEGVDMLLDTTAFRQLQGLPEYQRLVAEVRGRGETRR